MAAGLRAAGNRRLLPSPPRLPAMSCARPSAARPSISISRASSCPSATAANGRMSGKMSTIAASFSRGDGAQDRGKWWVAGDQLCQQWSSWMDGKSYCYKLTRDGATVHWVRNDGHSGTARIGG